mmetsp:Transcript_18064/g.59328  ORF Transcript_18064/g.59328 Transcript_18064/m.59328 type:complete len:381 (+) Transcript_18064:928-2070(+)
MSQKPKKALMIVPVLFTSTPHMLPLLRLREITLAPASPNPSCNSWARLISPCSILAILGCLCLAVWSGSNGSSAMAATLFATMSSGSTSCLRTEEAMLQEEEKSTTRTTRMVRSRKEASARLGRVRSRSMRQGASGTSEVMRMVGRPLVGCCELTRATSEHSMWRMGSPRSSYASLKELRTAENVELLPLSSSSENMRPILTKSLWYVGMLDDKLDRKKSRKTRIRTMAKQRCTMLLSSSLSIAWLSSSSRSAASLCSSCTPIDLVLRERKAPARAARHDLAMRNMENLERRSWWEGKRKEMSEKRARQEIASRRKYMLDMKLLWMQQRRKRSVKTTAQHAMSNERKTGLSRGGGGDVLQSSGTSRRYKEETQISITVTG